MLSELDKATVRTLLWDWVAGWGNGWLAEWGGGWLCGVGWRGDGRGGFGCRALEHAASACVSHESAPVTTPHPHALWWEGCELRVDQPEPYNLLVPLGQLGITSFNVDRLDLGSTRERWGGGVI